MCRYRPWSTPTHFTASRILSKKRFGSTNGPKVKKAATCPGNRPERNGQTPTVRSSRSSLSKLSLSRRHPLHRSHLLRKSVLLRPGPCCQPCRKDRAGSALSALACGAKSEQSSFDLVLADCWEWGS